MKFLSRLGSNVFSVVLFIILLAIVVLTMPNMLIYSFVVEIVNGHTPSFVLFGLSMIGLLTDVALVAIAWYTVKVALTE